MERQIDGRLGACVPSSQVLASTTASHLGDARQVLRKLEASLLRHLDLGYRALRDPGIPLVDRPLSSSQGGSGVGLPHPQFLPGGGMGR